MVVVGVGILSPVFLGLAADVQQPVNYSHKLHISKGLACIDCHIGADVQAAATIPSVTKCMLCHAKLGKDKPEIKKVAAYAEKGQEIPWVRVYGFEPNALVRFQHAPHVKKGVECSTCHGDMANADTAQKLVKHNMGTCISCHRANKASDDCSTCHF